MHSEAEHRNERSVLSLMMIVRNEAENISRCLASVEAIFDEIVVVDTGSQDDTLLIANSCGANCLHFPWCDDFSAARNFALAQCTTPYVAYLDADEWLTTEDAQRLRTFKPSLKDSNSAYLVRQLSGPLENGGWLAIDQVRIFPRLSGVGWEGLVHEQIAGSLARLGVPLQHSGLTIQHSGYSEQSGLERRRKRNFALLQKQLAVAPEDPMTHFYWGQELLKEGRTAEGLLELEFAYKNTVPSRLVLRHIATRLMTAYVNTGKHVEAMRVLAEWPKERYLPHAMLIQASELYKARSDTKREEDCLRQAINTPLPKTASYDDPLVVERARYKLGWLCFETNRPLEAHQHFAAITEHPLAGSLGWKGLGIAALLTSRWDDALRAAHALEENAHSRLDGVLLRAQVHMRQGEHLAHARALLEHAIIQHPHSVNAWLFLAQCYLRDKNTWSQAIPVLERVLELEPSHKEARHNLRLILGAS